MGKITDDPNRVIEFDDNIDAWIDTVTGLMWEVKTEENIEHEYVWSEKWVDGTWLSKNLTDDTEDAFSYAKKLNTQWHGGFSDWRVPTKKELETILIIKEINGYYIKAPLSENSSNGYWSSTSYEGSSDYAWSVYFYSGYVYYDSHAKDDSYYVRCVRDGQ
ncbi:MAG: DUF1566 domain-containing protein [Campylobacterota bacterium]|nr:DUF1566 domain-containing protein [Campylobacterota bacterium]